MKQLLETLTERYHPIGVIVYGSYADGTNDGQSDFDALLILAQGENFHDTSRIHGVRLDVFGYSEAYLRHLEDPDEILQIHGGRVLLDRDGLAAQLLKRVDAYIAEASRSTREEKCQLRQWCRKMRSRAGRNDPEGNYRAHWLLTDSLSIYCQLRDRFYFGPKKAIGYLKENDPEGYRLLCAALARREDLGLWIDYVCKEIQQECEHDEI